jgi:dihydrolipoamide dehydrogenase
MVVGEFTIETDLVVIGGGPGGYSAAFRAAELGIETTIVDDRQTLGGNWLHEGCILTKELLHIADTIRAADHAKAFGVEFGPPRMDFDRMRAGLRSTVDGFAASLTELCEKRSIAHVSGRARFESSRQLAIADNTAVPRIHFRRAIIATGSRNLTLPQLDFDSPRIMHPRDALMLESIPDSLLVIGASAAALELATAYASLGSRVTLVDRGDRLLTCADPDLVKPLRQQLDDTIDEICLNTTLEDATDNGTAIDVRLGGDDARTARFDRVLVAIGREPNLAGLELERTKVKLNDDGFIQVDDQLRTTDARIFAIGDLLGKPMLALKATHQGRIAAEAVAGWGSHFDARVVPMVLFTDPQIAWCGLTEDEAREQQRDYEVHKTRWVAAGQTTGFHRSGGYTKIVYEPDAQVILGLGIVGPNAAELIAEGALAIEMGAVMTDLAATIHPHPTHSEFLSAAAQEAERSPHEPTT